MKSLCYVLLYLVYFVYVFPEMLQSKQNEIILRLGTMVSLPSYAVLYYYRNKSPILYGIALPTGAFIQSGSAVWLRVVMMKNKSTMHVNPIYITAFQIVYYTIGLSLSNEYIISSLLTIFFYGITMTLQIRYINNPQIPSNSFWRTFLQLMFFILTPLIWDKYVHMRRDLELFLLHRKTEKDRATFEEII